MTDLGQPISTLRARLPRIDWAWAASVGILAAVAVLAPADLPGVASKALSALLGTAPYILFAVAATAYLRAASAEGVAARAFTGAPVRMIVFAALVGGLSPFCSCEVVPFIAALLAMGAPLSAVMAFWLASPLMDPPMFAITSGAIGLDFAIAKTIAAVGVGLIGGFGVMALGGTRLFADPLRPDGLAARRSGGCCGDGDGAACGSGDALSARPVWVFWRDKTRRATFRATAAENALFLGKWLTLAYIIEASMIRWIPAEHIANLLGGDGIGAILLAAVLGAPAYLNGYAAAPLAGGLIEQGMNPGAAMAFMVAGGVTSVPAAMAVWSLVRARVFAGYLGFALIGSVTAGLAFAAWS